MTNLTAQLINAALAVAAFMLVASACMVGMWLLFDREDAPAPEAEVDYERHVKGMGR